jgi:hypothetical protein
MHVSSSRHRRGCVDSIVSWRVPPAEPCRRVATAVAALTALCPRANAQAFSSGDIFVGGNSYSGADHSGQILVFDHSGNLLNTITTGAGHPNGPEQLGMAFDASGDLYANSAFGTGPGSSGTTYQISHIDSSVTPFVNNDANSHNESIVFNQTGHMFIGQPDGTRDILERDATGALVNTYNVSTQNRGSDWIDLAANQTTMFYTSEGNNVYRWDLTANAPVANFNTTPLPGSSAYALRILSDGSVLVADTDRIVKLDSSGNLVQTYALGTDSLLFALNLDPDGTSFWTAGYFSGELYQYDIASGSLLTSFNTGGGVSGLALFGEITQGGPPTELPDGGNTALLLGMAVVMFAGLKKRFFATQNS